MKTKNIIRKNALALTIASLITLTGCNSGSTSGDGTLSLGITDAPIDGASNVYVQFSSVQIQAADGISHSFDFDVPKQIDLLSLQGSDSAPLLEGVVLPAGQYETIRLMVDTDANQDSYIVLDDGSSHELTIPSGAETGLKLVRGFDVAVGGSADFMIDFDLRKSITSAGISGTYFLKPALRIVDNSQIGHISGVADVAALCDGVTDPDYSVYVFEGSDVSPDDTGSATEVLTTALLDDSYNYGVGFLNAGDYTLAFTCIAGDDNPETDEQNFGNEQGDGFVATSNVTVVKGETTIVDF